MVAYDDAVSAARVALGSALKRTGTQNGQRRYNGPCPRCGGHDRFRVAQGATAVIVKCSHDCSFKDLLDVLGLADGNVESERVRPPGAKPRAAGDESPGLLVAAAWERAQSAGGTPVETYLVDRRLWPADRSGGWSSFIARGGHWPAHSDGNLPIALGWIPATVAVDVGKRIRLPKAAAGWAVYAFGRLGSSVVSALQLEAITSHGVRVAIPYTPPDAQRPVWKKRLSIPGSRFPDGAVFTVRPGLGTIHVTEGPPDGFALLELERMQRINLNGGAVVAAAGTELLSRAVADDGDPVTIWAQRDINCAGETAALKARQAIRERTQREVRIEWGQLGQDWADRAWREGGHCG